MSVLCCGRTMYQFFRQEFLECAVVSFVVRVETWVESSEIVFVNSAAKVWSNFVAVARFSIASVWYCCILVKSAALPCAYFTFAAYPFVFEVLDNHWVYLNALARLALKLIQVFSSLGFRDHYQKSS